MSGQYSYIYRGAQIKLEKLSEVKRSIVEDSTTASTTSINGDAEVEVLPTPEKVNLIVSLDDDEEPGHLHSCPDTTKDNVANQSESEVDVAGRSSNKKQKLDSPLLMVLQKGNSSLTVDSRFDDDNDNSNCSTLSASSGDENIYELDRGSSMGILDLEPSASNSSISITTPLATNSKDNSQYKVKVFDDKISFDVKNQEELNKKIESLAKLPDISSVKSIEINSDPENNLFIGFKQIKALCSMPLPHLEKLHIGLNFHESITSKLFEDLLVKIGENLVHFHVTGGYIGVNREEIVVRIPPLPKLEHFSFQSIYRFDTSNEVIDMEPDKVVQNGGVELVTLEDDDYEIPTSNGLFRITIFIPRLKCLKEIVLGNYIKVITSDPLKYTVEEFSFEYFKQLEVFKVGSPWNELVHFLPAKYYKVDLKEIQFPDLLKDPFVLSKIAEIFPNLESIRLNLPSPFVLQQFIQIFSKLLGIKKLDLRTSFLFEGTDVKILCGLYRAKEGEEERKIGWFGTYGNLDGFEKLEKEETPKLLGLGSLKKIESFKFQHIPRKIYFSGFKTTIGFVNYSEGFPGRDRVPNFIQELGMMRNLNHFQFPKVHKDLASYLANRLGLIKLAPIGIYPKLLKVNKNKTDDAGKKVKIEVKRERK